MEYINTCCILSVISPCAVYYNVPNNEEDQIDNMYDSDTEDPTTQKLRKMSLIKDYVASGVYVFISFDVKVGATNVVFFR